MDLCILCGDHPAITEYFEDEMFYYCPKYDKTISEDELEETYIEAEDEKILERELENSITNVYRQV